MLLWLVVAYLVVSIGIGLYAATRVHNARDYITAGRNLPMIVVLAMVFATWFGAETVLGISATFIEEGFSGLISDPLGASACLVLFGLLFARPLYRMNLLTLGDFFRMRYNRTTELVLSICIVLSYLGWVAAQITALGLVFNVLSGDAVTMNQGMLIGAGVVLGVHPVRRHVVGGHDHLRADDRDRDRPDLGERDRRRHGGRLRRGRRQGRSRGQVRVPALPGRGRDHRLDRRLRHHGARLDPAAGRVPARELLEERDRRGVGHHARRGELLLLRRRAALPRLHRQHHRPRHGRAPDGAGLAAHPADADPAVHALLRPGDLLRRAAVGDHVAPPPAPCSRPR